MKREHNINQRHVRVCYQRELTIVYDDDLISSRNYIVILSNYSGVWSDRD